MTPNLIEQVIAALTTRNIVHTEAAIAAIKAEQYFNGYTAEYWSKTAGERYQEICELGKELEQAKASCKLSFDQICRLQARITEVEADHALLLTDFLYMTRQRNKLLAGIAPAGAAQEQIDLTPKTPEQIKRDLAYVESLRAAQYALWDGRNRFWTHWAPLPKRRDE